MKERLRIFANINWIFFLFGFLLLAGSFIEGMDKSFKNNYVDEDSHSSFKNFPEDTKFLYDFPNIDTYIPLQVEKFPFHLFTHFIVKKMDDTGKHKTPWFADTLTSHSILKNQVYLRPYLEEKTLLVSVKSKDFNESLLERTYEHLAALQTAFPDSNCGLVLEFDTTKVKVLIDDFENELIVLNDKILQAKGKFSQGSLFNHYICLNYTFKKTQDLFTNQFTNLQQPKLPNYKGIIIKVFDNNYTTITRFNQLDKIIRDIDHILKNRKKSIEQKRKEYKELNIYQRYLGSKGDSLTTIIDSLVEVKHSLKKNIITCIPSYPVIANDSKKNKVNIEKWNPTSLSLLNVDPVYSKLFYELAYSSKDTIAYETSTTLQSTLNKFKNKGLNIGFQGFIEPIYAETYLEGNEPKENPMAGILKYAKGNVFKKILKKPSKVEFYETSPKNKETIKPSPVNQSEWYWQTVEKAQLIGVPKPPDYLLFFFTPFFAFKIILPIYMMFLFGVVHRNAGNNFFEKVELGGRKKWGIPSAYIILTAEFFTWILIAFLFLYKSSDENNIYTYRTFAIILLLAFALGRPAVKFIIKFVKIGAKPMGIGLFRKLIKMFEPLLEIIYYRLPDDEKEKVLHFIADKDADRDFYNQMERNDIDVKKPNEKEIPEKATEGEILVAEHWGRATQFFTFQESPRLGIQLDENSNKPEFLSENNKGKTELQNYRNVTRFFYFLFLVGVLYGLSRHYYYYSWQELFGNRLILQTNFFATASIFTIELGIILLFFKEYYVFRLFKMFD